MENSEKLFDELAENSNEIEKYEQEIERLEAEVKILKQKGSSARMEMLEKQLKISELEGEILTIQQESDRKSTNALKKDLIHKKSNQYPEYNLLGACYSIKNDLDIWRNELETLQIRYKILQQSGSKDAKAYSELRDKIEITENTIQTSQEQHNKNIQQFSKRFGKEIDFSKSFTDILYEYDRNNEPVKQYYDVRQLHDDIEKEYSSGLDDDKFKSEADMEKYRENVQEHVSSIFTDGLDGTSKELAQVYSEIYVSEMDLGNEPIVSRDMLESSILGRDGGTLSKVVKSYNGYVLIYENEEGTEIGIKCARNAQTGKIEVQQDGILKDDGLGGLKQMKEQDIDDSNSISFEQIEMQVVKNNIQKSMQGKKVGEILQVTDSKIVQYFNKKNNLQQYSILNMPPKVYMISTQDKDGKIKYEFVAHDGAKSYTKLSGIEQVQAKQSHIILDEDRVQGSMIPMQSVDCQFVDRNGNSYYVTHPFGTMPMKLSFEEAQREEKYKTAVDTKDYGLNGLFQKARINELFRAGRNAMGIGYEKVKQIISKYRSKENVKEQDNEKTMDE